MKVLFSIFILLITNFHFTLAQTGEQKFIKLTHSEHCKTLLFKKENKLEVFIKVLIEPNTEFHNFLKTNSSLILNWTIRNKPDEDAVYLDSLRLNKQNFSLGKDYFECHFPSPILPENEMQILTFNISNNDKEINFKMVDRITNTSNISYSFFPHKSNTTFPLLDQYCKQNDTLQFHSSSTDSITVQHFSTTDSIALPPMFLGDNPYYKKQKTETFPIASNSKFITEKTGLYVFSTAKSNSKFSIVCHNTKFPNFTKPNELINALHYILTNEERSNLLNTPNPKEALDEFLINLTGDKNIAKDIVKNYFKRATEANKLFTNTKEGWKTDKGMVYIIFGKPDRVYYENGHEDWAYEKNSLYNELNFYFEYNNTNEGYSFDLERLKDYQEIWNSIVDKWRRGLMK